MTTNPSDSDNSSNNADDDTIKKNIKVVNEAIENNENSKKNTGDKNRKYKDDDECDPTTARASKKAKIEDENINDKEDTSTTNILKCNEDVDDTVVDTKSNNVEEKKINIFQDDDGDDDNDNNKNNNDDDENNTNNATKSSLNKPLNDYLNIVGSIMYPPKPQKEPPIPILERPTALGYLTSPIFRPSIIQMWSPYEISLFEASISMHGKDFHILQKFIKSKTTKDIIEFYYVWKKTNHYRKWKKEYYEADFNSQEELEYGEKLVGIVKRKRSYNKKEKS